MRIRLLGDHSDYHGGSAAAFAVIRDEAARHGEIVVDGEFDVLIVNGEGSMHHDGGACRRKAREISHAISSGRAAVLVNTVWQSNSAALCDAVRGCRQIVAREVLSQKELSAGGLASDVAIDQSFFHCLEDDGPIEQDDRPATTDFFARDFGRFVRVQGKYADQHHFLDMKSLSWSQLVRTLRTKSLLLTGRHHAVYAACKARTPFLAVRGNTHKIEGLIASSGIEIPVFDTFLDMQKNLTWPERNADAYERLFDWMERQEPWRLRLD